MNDHDQRIQIYIANAGEFWEAYGDYATSNWNTAIQELSKTEFAEGFAALQLKPQLKTDSHARREAAQKISLADRPIFWKAVNRAFVQYLLEIGVLGWPPIEYAKQYGNSRSETK